MTVLAASTPARRAARIPPVAAMREEFATAGAASLRRRTVIGVVVGAVGVVASVAGVASDRPARPRRSPGSAWWRVAAAAMLLSPVLARWVIDPMGRVVGRPFGPVGRLARTNAVRNPRRTAATAFALTLGLLLVAGIAVRRCLGEGEHRHAVRRATSRADYILTTDAGVNVPVPAAQAAAQGRRRRRRSTQLHGLDALVDGRASGGAAVDGPLTAVLQADDAARQRRHGRYAA